MRLIEEIRALFANLLVPFGGTISLPTGKEEYPIVLSNEANGGHHGFKTVDDLAQVTIDKLMVPMLASVDQYVDEDGNIIKGVTYKLEKMPPKRIADIPNYDISLYWKVFKAESDFVGSLETQYAPDYNNRRPLFQEPNISPDRYQAGYASNIDDTIIWEDEYDASKKHKWQRQRYGSNSKWGIPVQVYSEGYEKGNYIDNIFKWVNKGSPAPSRPVSYVNGKANNEPEGWLGTPEPPNFIAYDDYVNGTNGQSAHELYQSTASKNVYQQLLSEWSIPIKISTDPLLVRYGNEPTSTDYLNELGTDTWRGYYTPGRDTHRASRPDLLSEWEITQIDGESGEYTEFVYKQFPANYEPTDADAPTDPEPYKKYYADGRNAPNDWKDAPYKADIGYILYYSIAKKFNDGSLKRRWSRPKRADGLDTIQAVIEPQGKYIFKKTIANGVKTIDPAQVVLKAVLYMGNEVVTEGATVKWFKGAVEIGAALPNHTLAGDTLTITPEAVDGLETYRAEITYQNKTFSDPINILDVTDGQAFEVAILSTTGFTYKTETEKSFSAQFYKNGLADNTGVAYAWELVDNDGDVTTYDTKDITISASIVDDYASLTVTATFGDIERKRTETLTDVKDGKGYELQYSRSSVTDADDIPAGSWYGGVDADWANWPTGAIWKRIRKEGAATWNNPIRIAGEKGTPNGGFSRNVFKNSITKPSFNIAEGEHLSVKDGLYPNVAGWTDDPGPLGEGESRWESHAFFTINPNATINADGTIDLTPANWVLNNRWSEPVKVSANDSNSSEGGGEAGNDGWNPEYANVSDGERVVQQVVDWFGGEGNKPATGMYVSSSGFTTMISRAKNIRGRDGEDGKDGVAKGIKEHLIATGGSFGSYTSMGSFSQGQVINTGNSDYKKLRIRAWVSTSSTQYITTLRLTRSMSSTFKGSLISQRNYHTQHLGLAMQYQIDAYINTNSKYIGFTFSDDEVTGGGSKYGDYGLEVLILE